MFASFFRLSRCLAVLALLLGVLLVPDTAAQKPKRTEEEEEPVRPKLKPPLRIDDEEPPKGQRIGARPVDLAREAEQAKHAAVREMYRRLAVPHEEVIFPAVRPAQWVQPIPRFIGSKPDFEGKLTVHGVDAAGKAGKDEEVTRKQIKAVEHYEELALTQAALFLEKVKDDASLPPLEALQHAEKALAEVVRFHEFARERGLRTGAGWEPLERELRGRLRGVRIAQLKALANARDWAGVLELAAQLMDIYPRDREVSGAIIAVHVQRLIEGLIDDKPDTFIAARQGLEQLERQFADTRQHEAAQPLRDRLQAKAGQLLKRVRELAEKKNLSAAVATLRTAENIWPQLPGLQELRQKLGLYNPLGVGVHFLPSLVSPTVAISDADRQGVELVFESLLRPVADPLGGQRYEPVLAAGAPRLIPLGRQFQLVRDACWYRAGKGGEDLIDEPVTAADVSRTVALYQKSGRYPEWSELLGEARVEDSAYQLRLSLRQGWLDPLGLMSFKVLPAKYLEKIDDRAFAANPVGSGPYQYLGIKREASVEFALFLANPTYGRRAGKQDLPRIQAIHFYKPRDEVQDFTRGNLHLLLDLPTPSIKKLKGVPKVTVHTLRNRRVWFLAVNHRKERLQKVEVRRALAHAIDREKILNDIFRDGVKDERGDPVHRPLNGPYPPGCWACDPGLPADPYKPALAKNLAKNAGAAPLTLLFPNDLPQVEDACRAIQEQAEAVGLKVVLKGAPLREVHQAVVQEHTYELAYFYWDHPGDTFWLGPLLDARGAGPGGPNFLGPLRNAELENLLTQVREHRDFHEVQRLTRLIHQQLYHQMPLIPLWQLDTHLAVHAELKTVPVPAALDSLRVFTHVEQWRLEK